MTDMISIVIVILSGIATLISVVMVAKRYKESAKREKEVQPRLQILFYCKKNNPKPEQVYVRMIKENGEVIFDNMTKEEFVEKFQKVKNEIKS